MSQLVDLVDDLGKKAVAALKERKFVQDTCDHLQLEKDRLQRIVDRLVVDMHDVGMERDLLRAKNAQLSAALESCWDLGIDERLVPMVRAVLEANKP